jgi:chromosome segregation ATPase
VNDPLGRIEALEQENKQLKEHQQEQDERLKAVEQATEPIELKIVRGLPLPEATLLQNIMDQVGRHGPDIASLKTDVSVIKRQLEEHGKMLEEILKRLPEKGE